jgi:prepilin-type processing-associated H-X9-DG protein
MQCANNLKQIGLATVACEEAKGVLPPLGVQDIAPGSGLEILSPIQVPGPYKGYIGYTLFAFLLPYIEMGNLDHGDITKDAAGQPVDFWTYVSTGADPKPVFAYPISAYRCPDEPSPAAGTGMVGTTWGGANYFAACNYAGNFFVFGNPQKASTEGSTRFADIKDGVSNTIFFAEKYATCNLAGDPASNAWGNIWGDPDAGWQPAFCANSPKAQQGYSPGCSMFQDAPDWTVGCDMTKAQSPHGGGITVALGDGSVTFIGASISQETWERLCDPRDGAVLKNDW